jgi:hypothetical protein
LLVLLESSPPVALPLALPLTPSSSAPTLPEPDAAQLTIIGAEAARTRVRSSFFNMVVAPLQKGLCDGRRNPRLPYALDRRKAG